MRRPPLPKVTVLAILSLGGTLVGDVGYFRASQCPHIQPPTLWFLFLYCLSLDRIRSCHFNSRERGLN